MENSNITLNGSVFQDYSVDGQSDQTLRKECIDMVIRCGSTSINKLVEAANEIFEYIRKGKEEKPEPIEYS